MTKRDKGIELIQRSGLSKEIWPPAWVQAILILLIFLCIALFVLGSLL